MSEVPSVIATNIVIVHGGFVDGSGWESVYKILRNDCYAVSTLGIFVTYPFADKSVFYNTHNSSSLNIPSV
jgi:hypothetical protein